MAFYFIFFVYKYIFFLRLLGVQAFRKGSKELSLTASSMGRKVFVFFVVVVLQRFVEKDRMLIFKYILIHIF